MNTDKKYRLLKDYFDPCGSVMAGVIKDEYQWMARFALLNPGDCAIKKDWFEEVLPEQSLPKEPERIEVSHLWKHDNFKGNGNDSFWYQFCTSKPIEHINNSKIKQAIENVLNDAPPQPAPSLQEEKKDAEINHESTSYILKVGYNRAISHAVDIVEANYRTMHSGTGATGKNPELLLTQIINSLTSLKKK